MSPNNVLIWAFNPATGKSAPISLVVPSGDDINPPTSLSTIAFNYGYDQGEFAWDRMITGSATGAPFAGSASGNQLIIAQTYAFDPLTNEYFPVYVASNNGSVSPVAGPNSVNTIAQLYALNTTDGNFDRLLANATNADALATVATGSLQTIAQLFGYNGATFDRIRIATIFHTVLATAAGSTAVWTPTAGKSFRLMGYTISVAGTMAATGVQALQLRDAAVVIKNHLANVIETQTVSISGGDTQIGADLGQGQLSAAPNNVLNINLGTAMATGGVAVNVWGTEE